MAKRSPGLRAVKSGEKQPKRKPPLSVSEAAEKGSHRDLLVAMRTRIAQTVANPDCPPRDLAALTRRLQDIAKEIEAIDLRTQQEEREDAGGSDDEEFDASAI